MRAFKVLFSLIILSLFSMSLFLSESLSQESDIEETWMGIYSDHNRVGYSYNSIDMRSELTQVKELTSLRVNLLGKDTDVYTEGSYELKGYKIQSFSYEMTSDTINLKAWGKRRGDALQITMETVSGKTERILPFENELILPALVPKLLADKGLKPGLSLDAALFEPLSLLMGMKDPMSRNTVKGEQIVKIPSGTYDTYIVQTNFMGAESKSWITKEGSLVKQEFPPGLVAMRESRDQILSKENSSFNIIQKTSIPVNVKIKDAKNLAYLKIKVGGIEIKDFDIDDGYRQFVDGQTIKIKTGAPTTENNVYSLPYKQAEYREYIEPDFLVQSDDEEIVSLTQEILDGEKNPLQAAKKINTWIYKNLKKSATVSLPNAKDVLKTKVGDCNEHAALFSAMSRSAGIPTKTVLGIMYHEESFYYHAWNEVFVGRWVAVDSTYGQFPADATHLKLIEGNLAKSGEISKVVGKLNIEIIDAS